MKKLILLSILLIVGCASTNIITAVSPIFSTEKYLKIAIPTKHLPQHALDLAFYDAVEIQLIRLGFIVINRDQIDRIMEEQKLSHSGIIDESTAVELGQLLGVDSIVLLKHSREKDGTKSASIKFVDVNNGMMLLSSGYDFSYGWYENPSDVVVQLFNDIEKK